MITSYSPPLEKLLACFSAGYWYKDAGTKPPAEVNRRFPFAWPEGTGSLNKTEQTEWESSKEAKTFVFLRFRLGKLMLWHSDTSSISISAKLIKKIVLHTAVNSTSPLSSIIPSVI